MEEIEVPLEKTTEDMHHEIEHGGGHSPKWIMLSALLSAFLAVFAAIFALMAGAHVNESMIMQMKASDSWSHYQSKSIKSSLMETRLLILEGKEKPEDKQKAEAKIEQYKEDLEKLSEKAREYEEESEALLHKHEIFARSVTLFQIAIAMTAIAVLTKKRKFMYVSAGLGLLGLLAAAQVFIHH